MLLMVGTSISAQELSPFVERSPVGRRVHDFVLPDTNDQQVAFSDYRDADVRVVVFLGTECPIANAYLPALQDLQNRYNNQSVRIIGINANPADSPQEIRQHAAKYKINFPVLLDHDQQTLDLLGAVRTPDVFVIDHRSRIRYAGRIDDRIGYDFRRDQAQRNDLEEAILELLSGREVTVSRTPTMGCKITRRNVANEQGKITYASHVASILHQRCANCHHQDTAAPFSLLSYADARDRAEMIREVISQRRMPPWDIDSRHGTFRNDLSMTKAEIDTVVRWIDDGAVMGDENAIPESPQFAAGWINGVPDLAFQMPESYQIPATGAVEYQYFVTPTHLSEDVWVQAAEARPGNRSVVHHIIVSVREKGSDKLKALPMLTGFAPGEEPTHFPQGVGFRIPAGAELVWELHYTPQGVAESDRSELGLILCKTPPQRHVEGGGIFNFEFKIPPGARGHEVVAETTMQHDVELLTLMPHMHVRGKDFQYSAHFPDGRVEVLLSVPHYDFNWQHSYRFQTPLLLPQGTRIRCVAHFDNSADNPNNPDPTKTVTWGDQTWQEMMIGWYSGVRPLSVLSGKD